MNNYSIKNPSKLKETLTPSNTSTQPQQPIVSKSIADLLNTKTKPANIVELAKPSIVDASQESSQSSNSQEPTTTTLANLKQVDGMDDSQQSDITNDKGSSELFESFMSLNQEYSNAWYDIVISSALSYTVTEYSLSPAGADLNKADQTTVALFKKQLEPGTAYKFRVSGINACGKGPWSEVSAFSTCMPGYPGAPSSIKITKVLFYVSFYKIKSIQRREIFKKKLKKCNSIVFLA